MFSGDAVALKKLPKVRGTCFGVTELESGAKPKETYLVRGWADAQGASSKLRTLLKRANAEAKKKGKAPVNPSLRM